MKYFIIFCCLFFIGCVGFDMKKKKTSNQQPNYNEQQPTNTQEQSRGQDCQSDGGTVLPGEPTIDRGDSSNGTPTPVQQVGSGSDNPGYGDGGLFQNDTGVPAQSPADMDRSSLIYRCRLFLSKEEVFKYFVRGGILIVILILCIGWIKEKRKHC